MLQMIFKEAVKASSVFSIHTYETNSLCKYVQLAIHLAASYRVPIPSSLKAKKRLCNYLSPAILQERLPVTICKCSMTP